MGKIINYKSVEVGFELPKLEIDPVTHATLVRYAGASGDFNPIHNDPDFARKVGLDGTIAHGMFVMAQVGRLCTNWVSQKQIRFFGIKFKAMTKLGEKMTCVGTVKKKKEENGQKIIYVSVDAVGQDGVVKAAGDLEIIC